MLVFGGYPYKGGFAYALDLTDMTWDHINGVQYTRYAHSANLIGGSIFLFGGDHYNSGSHNDLQRYDVKS